MDRKSGKFINLGEFFRTMSHNPRNIASIQIEYNHETSTGEIANRYKYPAYPVPCPGSIPIGFDFVTPSKHTVFLINQSPLK